MNTIDASFWIGRRVLICGHTGFKGSWLTLLLARLGANVSGFALAPPTTPSCFDALTIAESCLDHRGDVRDHARLAHVVHAAAPEVVFHLAAQPLVRDSYRSPTATFATNVMGTVHLLDALRTVDSVRAVVVVTTDKVYAPQDPPRRHRESDPLGGEDPYSASKTAVENAVASFRASFFTGDRGVGVATARAGNVIGGGDWSNERLIPDAVRAINGLRPVRVRNPHAIRPWQHVIDPLRGYMMLAERLVADPTRYARAWNFGPSHADDATVGAVMARFCVAWGDGASWVPDVSHGQGMRESDVLTLDSTDSRSLLGWTPISDLDRAIDLTVEWYRAHAEGVGATALRAITLRQSEIARETP